MNRFRAHPYSERHQHQTLESIEKVPVFGPLPTDVRGSGEAMETPHFSQPIHILRVVIDGRLHLTIGDEGGVNLRGETSTVRPMYGVANDRLDQYQQILV